MDISKLSTLGSSSVQATQLLALLSASSGGTSSDSSSAVSGIQSDSVSISAAGQSISDAQGPASFMTDFNNLGTLISSGDLAGAKKALAAMQAKMQANQPSGSSQTDSSSSTNPLLKDMDKLSSLLSSGDTTDAQTLLNQIEQKLQNGPPASQSTTSSDAAGTQTLNAQLLSTYLSSGSLS